MYYIARALENRLQKENIWEIIHRGGYPELQDKGKEWSAFYADYVKTFIKRDVRKLAAVQDLNAFRQLMIVVVARTGEILNYSSMASEIGTGVVVCNCPDVGMLWENVLQMPVWYI